MSRSQGFWNFMAKRYSRQAVSDPAAYERKLEITRELLKSDMELLEFGCGTGTTALKHAPHVAHIDAIDYSSAMIDIARAKAWDASITNVTFKVATIEGWNARDASYDMVQAHSILHLVQDLDAVLGKVRALIKPGGVFISSTVCMGEESRLVTHLVKVASASRLLPYIGPFDGAQLMAAIQRAGFEIQHKWRPREKGSVFVVARAV